MRLNLNNQMNKSAERDLAKEPDASKRLTRLLKLIEADLATLPLDGDLPAAVAAALTAHKRAIDIARRSIAEHEASAAGVGTAAAEDVSALAKALKTGKAIPRALKRAAARTKAELTGVTLEAAEDLIKTTQTDLIDAIRDNWAAMHRGFADGGEEKRAAAADALAEVVADLGPATRDFASIAKLDAQIRARFPALKTAVDAEQRDGIGWYDATHNTRAPLTDVRLPDPANKGQTLGFPLLDVAAALLAAVAQPGAFAVSCWCPPDDAQHEQMRDAPLPDEPWVASAVAREQGRGCAICGGGSKADLLTRIGGHLQLAHGTCLRKPPSDQEKKRTARLARMASGREPYPPSPNEATQIVPDGGRVKKLDA